MAGDVRLPDIKASVKVDTKDVASGLDRVQSSTVGVGKGFEGLQNRARGAIDSMSSSLTSKLGPASGAAESALNKLSSTGAMMGAGVAAGAAVAGVAIGKLALQGAQEFVALADEIRNFQRASGASAEDSSRFVAVLDDLGVSSDVGAKAVFKLRREIGEGGKKLGEYGVEVARAKDGTADVTGTLLNLADAYVKTNDPGKRAAMVMDTLGKQGQELIPVLEQGRKGLDAFFQGVKPGELMSAADLQKARDFELAMDDLQDSLREVRLEGGSALLPFLTDLASGGVKLIEFGQKVDDKAAGALSRLAQLATNAAGGPLSNLVQGISSLGAKSDGTKRSTKELAEEIAKSEQQSKDDAAAKVEQARALGKLIDATRGTISSQLGYEASVNTLKDNINDLDDRTREYNDAVVKNGENSKEAEAANRALRDAHLGIEQSAVAAADAAVRLADDQATAAGQSLNAKEKSDVFRDALVDLAGQADGPTRDAILGLADQILGLPDRTVYIDADISAAQNKLASIQRQINSVSAGADSTSGAQQFARGLDVGPVKGPPGAAVPIIAHAGEWVVTPAQLADLRGSPAPGVPTVSGAAPSTAPAGHGHDIFLDGQKVGVAVAPGVAKGLHRMRRG